ncbi:MAG: thermonuclease family protein [Clostridium sp.]|nr:MAG: thermonuclease family protein [Clostridium sp.]
MLDDKKTTVRFLAVDTPETKHPTKGEQPFGKEASKYTCDKVKNAKKLEIEYDKGSSKVDKYDRTLAWIFTDDLLLQKDLVSLGYAKVAYLYGDYKYTDELKERRKYC